jgi:hypothetical protein
VRLKGKAGDLGGRARGRPARIAGRTLRGRWSEEEERKGRRGRCRAGPSGQREGERERERGGGGPAGEKRGAAVRAGPSAGELLGRGSGPRA